MTLDPSLRSPPPSLEGRRQAVFRLWLFNLAFATVIGVNYLWHVPEVDSPRMWLFALPALLSTTLILTVVPGFVFWVLARYVSGAHKLGLLQACFWSFGQTLLFADTRVFNMFRYHMNSQVLNLIYRRGSEDAIHLGWQVWTSILVGLASVVLLQLWFWNRSLRKVEARLATGDAPLFARPWLLTVGALLPAVFVEKTLYAQADLNRDRQITHLARLFPLYARVPMEDLASSVLGLESENPPTPRLELAGFRLDYPHALPALAPDGPRPNVMVIVVDCLRADRLRPENTPNMHAFAQHSRVFEDHVSAGNSTRFGLFSLIYGLHGSYWFPTLNEQRSPVLIDTLEELGYTFGIFGSASMGYPEMRSTLWTAVDDAVVDDFGEGPPWQRDELAAEAIVEWLGGRQEGDPPFFGFVLFDSPHQTYSFPPDRTPFTPYAPELDYMSMTRNEGPDPALLEQVLNRYLNAVFHADRVVGRVLDALVALPDFEDTVVVITGDHGEEFMECGFFGHTSAYTPEQVRVPFVLRGPGIEPGVEEGPTSHLDFPATLLELMGANPAGRASWTVGQNLFAPDPDRRRVMGGWNELGVWTPHAVLRVPLSLFEFDVEAYDYAWRLIVDDAQILAEETSTLERLGAECNRFLR